MKKNFYKGKEVESINTYAQYDSDIVEITLEVIVSDDEGDEIRLIQEDKKGSVSQYQIDKLKIANEIGLDVKCKEDLCTIDGDCEFGFEFTDEQIEEYLEKEYFDKLEKE